VQAAKIDAHTNPLVIADFIAPSPLCIAYYWGNASMDTHAPQEVVVCDSRNFGFVLKKQQFVLRCGAVPRGRPSFPIVITPEGG
jgi:hypothetical protein